MALTDNLVSYWKMDEASGNRADSHGANTLTDNNTVLAGTGIIGNGGDFESTNSEYLSILDVTQSGLDITGDLSISFWFNAESLVDSTSYAILQKWETVRSFLFRIDVTAGSVRNLLVAISASGTSVGQTTGTKDLSTVNTGTLYHLVCVYTAAAGTVTVYKNASSLGDITSQNTSIANSAAAFEIGGSGIGGNYFDGIIDEVGIWSRVLTSGEVTSLYNGGAGLAYPLTVGSTKHLLLLGIGT